MKRLLISITMVVTAAACYAEPLPVGQPATKKPALLLAEQDDGTLGIKPELPAGTKYQWDKLKTPTPNGVWLKLLWIRPDGWPESDEYYLPLGWKVDPSPNPNPKPSPQPTPTPNPTPTPPSPPVARKLWIVPVYESSDLPKNPKYAWVLGGKAVRDLCREEGHQWMPTDKDEKDVRLKGYLDAAKGKSLPYVVMVIDKTGEIADQGPMPDGEAAMFEWIKKVGG